MSRLSKILFFIKDFDAFMKSIKEVLTLTAIALFPLFIRFIIETISSNSLILSLKLSLVPGEMLAYCLSFLAPSLYLLLKTHGSGYKLPFIHFFSITTFAVYVLSMVLYLIAKNGWVKAINMESQGTGLYFYFALIFFITSIIYRVYSIYHGINASKWAEMRSKQQQDFNKNFVESLS
jgi:hypothetical protein